MSDNGGKKYADEVDILHVGAGIMSATLSSMLHELEPDWSQMVFERLDGPAGESSFPFNNAGTGHSALCELNYTPEKNGRIDVSKAMAINEKFQLSRQFWSYQVENGVLTEPRAFINPVPHVSFAQGEDQIKYLRKRYDKLSENHMFPDMQFTDDRDTFAEKLPLMSKGRDFDAEPVAISWTNAGTDINYGSLTEQFLDAAKKNGTEIRYGREVTNIKREGNFWKVTVKNVHTGDKQVVRARFVFVGAGGYALDLLRKAGVPEVHGYAGFPISGMWLKTDNQELVQQHKAKVYGKAKVGAPPMSVPHLDTRVVDGKTSLLFGPYAGFSTNFLKTGSYLDLPLSVRPHNLSTMLDVAKDNMDLTKYLVTEVLKSRDKKIDALHEFYPEADGGEWELITAGQRVQVMKRKGRFGGVLQFGTEVVTHADGSLGGLLGASPGASTAAPIMVKLLERCFPAKMAGWDGTLKELIPSLGHTLNDDPALLDEVRTVTDAALKLA